LTTVDRSEALVERLFGATIGALELYSIHLGAELGLYAALERHGPMTAAELAQSSRIAPRYAHEWLEQQAVAGLLAVDDAGADAHARRYALDAEHARVLAAPDDAAHVAPFAHMIAGIGGALEQLLDAYRSGSGVPYRHYGKAFRHGQGHINRPAFVHELPTDWLDAMPDIRGRLRDRGGRVADLGCGQGFSTVAMARAFPQARVEGFDTDAASIADARRHAAETDVEVGLVVGDATAVRDHAAYDLVLVLETLHDLARPVETLAAIRASLAEGGAALVVDERVADSFVAPGDEVERMMFGWSVTHCLPTQLAEQPSAALGAALRPDTVRQLAAEAGFTAIRVLPVDNDFFRLYRLDA
jgi:2-polyprenyl-3-methyl-5-hydroxy-6-metoxy-1,4-benzoquinol methylase